MTNKLDVIDLAKTIFLQDIALPATQEVATEIVAEAALWAAHTFYVAADKYKAGTLDLPFSRLDTEREGLKLGAAPVERRRAERRTAEVAAEFDQLQHLIESFIRGGDPAKKAA